MVMSSVAFGSMFRNSTGKRQSEGHMEVPCKYYGHYVYLLRFCFFVMFLECKFIAVSEDQSVYVTLD